MLFIPRSQAQFLKKLKKRVEQKVENEVIEKAANKPAGKNIKSLYKTFDIFENFVETSIFSGTIIVMGAEYDEFDLSGNFTGEEAVAADIYDYEMAMAGISNQAIYQFWRYP
jgi:hypothetical protein